MTKKNKEEKKEHIVYQPVEDEMKQSYIDYAMSVIISRALPDVRDWLKPVQRRILYAMYDMKLTHTAKYKKSAAVVWEVLWKYHPHGDSSVYEAMVRMAQPFSLRYPLIDWQWNFGSIDGDWAAAMRYTEARLTKIAEEMLQDIEKQTIDWADNYDSSRQEPKVLPTKFPDLLCNWTMGIAVGMATNMPPHNLGEVVDALIYLMEHPDATVDDIMNIIKWPDFPTWWIIFDPENIKQVYAKWKWSIVVRWKIHKETEKWKNIIVIDELPYQVNKANLVAKIGQLVAEKKIDWIKDLTDESDKKRIRVSIVLKPGVDPDNILIKLYKLTDLQTTFPVNNVVLTENWLQPKLLNIKDLLQEFIDFRRTVVYRRSKYLLDKAKDRLHILEWLQRAIDIIDDVIATIRASKTREEAKQALMENFEFTDKQAEYILMLRLQTLVWLEIEKILNEIEEKKADIEYLTWIIEDKQKLDAVVIDELDYIKSTYQDSRKTQVCDDTSVYDLNKALKNLKKQEDFIKEDVLLWMWVHQDVRVIYQSRIVNLPEDTYKLHKTNNQEKVFVISEKWEFINPRIKDLPSTTIKWKPINWKDYGIKHNIVFIEPTDTIKDYLLLLTNKNSIKKISKEVLLKIRKNVSIMKLQPDEKIISVIGVSDGDLVGIITKKWVWLIFSSDDVRSMWRLSGWITAMWVADDDEVASMFNYYWNTYIVMFSNKWYWKTIMTEELQETKRWFIQKRWRKGFVYTKVRDWEEIVGALNIDEWDVRILLHDGQVRKYDVDKMPLLERNTYMEKIIWGKIMKVFKL